SEFSERGLFPRDTFRKRFYHRKYYPVIAMKHTIIAVILMLIACDSTIAQWSKVYQSDSCHCDLFRWPLAGMEFFGDDSGVVCAEGDGFTALTMNGGTSWDKIYDNPDVSWNLSDPI